MQLVITRHGEPDLTGEDLSDPPLTNLGERQAAATAGFLADTALDAVYVSPQRRAQQTSLPLLGQRGINPVTDERTAEFDYELGSYPTPATFAGMTRDEAITLLDQYQGPAFQRRVLSSFSEIVQRPSWRNRGGRLPRRGHQCGSERGTRVKTPCRAASRLGHSGDGFAFGCAQPDQMQRTQLVARDLTSLA